MRFHTRALWLTMVLAAALLAANATAADPNDKNAKDAPAKVDKDVEAWVNVLAAKIADRHDSIRESARHALMAIGKPALPALQKLANGDDGAAAEAAHDVIAHIEQEHDGHFGPHGFPGAMGQRRHGGFPPHPGGPDGGPGRRDGFGPPAGGPRGPGGPPQNRPGPDGAAPPPGPGAPPARPDGAPRGVTSPRDEANPFGGGFTRPDQRGGGPDGPAPMPPARPGAGGPASQPDDPGAAEPNGPGQRRPSRDGAAASGALGAGGPPPQSGAGGAAGPRGFGGGIAGPGFPGMLGGRAFQDLKLTDEQTAKVKEALESQVKKSREANEKAREDFMQTLRGVLDEEQIKKLESNLTRPAGPDNRPGRSDNPRPREE